MRKLTCFLLFVICLFKFTIAQPSFSKIDGLIQAYTNLYQFNGTVLVEYKGKVMLYKGYGLKNATDSSRNDKNTIYQLGSVTKQFTSTVILRLQDEGKLNVSDKISKYFKELPYGDSVTIENLLTHTSGIFNYTDDGAFMNNDAVKPSNRTKIIALFKDKPLGFTPGSRFSYSNSGYCLLGYIIEDVTGKKYEQVVREMILQPLKMKNSGFDFAGLKNRDKATGYLSYTDKIKMPATLVDSSASFSAGALYSTCEDLLKWHKGLLENTVLSAANQNKAFTPYKANYGYGWGIDSIYNKRRISHGGGIFGFLSNFVRIPEDDVCVVLLSNSNTSKMDAVTSRILAILYNQPYELPKDRVEIKVDSAVLKQYVGEYQIENGPKLTITLNNGNLMVQAPGQQKFQAFAEKENNFFLKVVDAQFQFVKDNSGKIDHLIWYQGGTEQTAKKITQ